jgi:hypothetical protein
MARLNFDRLPSFSRTLETVDKTFQKMGKLFAKGLEVLK